MAIAAAIALGTPGLAAQRASERRVANPGDTQFEVQLLRPSGGPVVPIFEGWYRNPDDTFELSFGYFNVNTEEALEIPLGPTTSSRRPSSTGASRPDSSLSPTSIGATGAPSP